MSAAVTLHGFAYGEHVDAVSRRSLGFRLLAPLVPEPWSAEVEALARRLQAAPYPDHWPAADLFCSVLLDDTRRLLALARYGLADHTATHRRGGLELVGVVAPADLDVAAGLTVYHWLRRRRAAVAELDTFGGPHDLAEVLASAPPAAPPGEPAPVLPVRLGQEGVLLFAATAPGEPDHHLRLLECHAALRWQWLPLVGADFPLQTYARRGPLIAWTPQLAGVALKVERPTGAPAPHAPDYRERFRTLATPALLALLVLLSVANLWATLSGSRRPAEPAAANPAATAPVKPSGPASATGPFAEALYDLILTPGGVRDEVPSQEQLLLRYEKLARAQPALRVEPASARGKAAVGLIDVLAQRSSGRLRTAVEQALAHRGYDAGLIQAAWEAIQRQLAAGEKGPP